MAFVPVSQTAKVSLKQTQYGQELMTILWFHFVVPITQAILDDLVAEVKAAWIARIKPQVSSTLSLHEVDATDQTVVNGLSSTLSFTPVAGSGTVGNGLPANVCAVITLKTANRGRSFRGRIYQPGIGDGVQGSDPNQITSAYATTLVGIWADFIADLKGAAQPATMVVASHFANKAPRIAGLATEISGLSANVFLDSQRRRLTGRGK